MIARCIRHSYDSRTRPIDECSVARIIVDDNGEVGLLLGHRVPASMRREIYNTSVVWTKQNVLCCKCSCQAGSQDDERIVCVHTLVPPYKLTMLLMEDLAEHLLITLAARIGGSTDGEAKSDLDESTWKWSLSNWSRAEVKEMKQSIITLMEAAGEPIHDTSNKTIPDVLESFVVGTEHRKEWIQQSKAVAKPSALGPITGMNFPSTTRSAKQQIEMKREMANSLARENEMDTPETLDSPPMLLPAEKPDYLKIIALGKASGNYASDLKFVGHRLLQSRAYAQMSECNDHFGLQNMKEKEATQEWKKALEISGT